MLPELHLPWMEISVLITLLGSIWLKFTPDRDRAYKRCIRICTLTCLVTICGWIDFVSLKTFAASEPFSLFYRLFHKTSLWLMT